MGFCFVVALGAPRLHRRLGGGYGGVHRNREGRRLLNGDLAGQGSLCSGWSCEYTWSRLAGAGCWDKSRPAAQGAHGPPGQEDPEEDSGFWGLGSERSPGTLPACQALPAVGCVPGRPPLSLNCFCIWEQNPHPG